MSAEAPDANDTAGTPTSAQIALPKPFRTHVRGKAAVQHLRFNPGLRPADASLKALVALVIVRLEEREATAGLRKRIRREADRAAFHLAITAIVANLAWLLHAAPELPLAVPRDRNLLHGKSRYRPACYGQGFVQALDLMAHPDVGLVENVQRGFKTASRSAPSLVRPLPAFAGLLRPEELGWPSFRHLEPVEVLVLKGSKDAKGEAAVIDYPDTDRTKQMRREVERLNRHLRDAPIFLVSTDGQPLRDKDGLPVDPCKRSLRRIFNNGSWSAGGRLYDGFWETMPRELRFKHLRLGSRLAPNGEPIANVDFGQLFPRLAYNHVRLEAPEGDLYDVFGDGSSRAGFKRLLNAMLFAKAPLRGFPDGAREAFPKGVGVKQACEAICGKHAPIASLFYTGLGYRLMLMESTALILASLELFARGIAALPLHDAVLTAASEAETARGVLMAALERATGLSRAAVSIEKA